MADLIDRQAVLVLPKNVTRNLSGKVVEESIDVELIKALPPVQTKHGEWEYIDFDLYSSDREIKCSCCGEEYVVDAPLYRVRAWDVEDLKYCPNCGAKMEVERR